MPLDFPDMKSLIYCAEVHKFRKRDANESENDYRDALADHVEPIDFIESGEIRYKVGWNRWTDQQKRDSVIRSMLRNQL